MDTRESYVVGVQVREGKAGEPSMLGGYAAVFNQETIIDSGNGVRWRERISPHAFDDAIGRDDVIAAVNHDHKMVLGRAKTGTLALTADAHGLRYDVTLPNTSLARDTVENVRTGNYPGSSFKFIVTREGMRIDKPAHGSDLPLITLERLELIDVGPVTRPAYVGTSVSARDASMVTDLLKQHERSQAEQAATDARERLKLRLAIERAKAWA